MPSQEMSAPSSTQPRSLILQSVAIAMLLAVCPSLAAGQGLKTAASDQQIHWIPTEGFAHPVFESADRDAMIEIYLTFGPPTHPGPDLARRLSPPLRQWRQHVAETTDESAIIKQQGHRRTVSVEMSGLDDPVAAAAELVQIYRDSSLPLSEVFLLRRQIDATGGRGRPLADPRMPEIAEYRESEALWNAVFDPSQPPPSSEDPTQEVAMATFPGGGLLFEIRGTPIFFDDVKVAYGAPEVETVEPDGRSLEIATALRRNFRKAFPRGSAPKFINTDGTNNRVIKLKHGQRIGYSFAIYRDRQKITPFIVRYPDGFRYREYELFRAVRAAVRDMDLAPVIFWNRDSKYIFYIWERLDS